MKKKTLISIILIGVLLILLGRGLNEQYQLSKSDKVYSEAKEQYYKEKVIVEEHLENYEEEKERVGEIIPIVPGQNESEESVIVVKERPKPIEILDKDAIMNASNVIGWLVVGDTAIDYPVVQAMDNEFYLDHNYLGNKDKKGAIYMDFRNDEIGLDRNYIIYGHKIYDGTMFSDLTSYIEGANYKEYFKKNDTITYDNFGYEAKWKIFSAYVVDLDKEEYHLSTNYYLNDKFQEFIDDIKERSLVKSDIEVTLEDEIITLVTCSYWYDNSRIIVHGVRQYE